MCPQDEALLLRTAAVIAISDETAALASSRPRQHQARVTRQYAFKRQVWACCQPCVQHDVPYQTL